ncbi:MAG TPA: hypothetical protein VF791_12000 [Pyrinomonadaceae bacterium]
MLKRLFCLCLILFTLQAAAPIPAQSLAHTATGTHLHSASATERAVGRGKPLWPGSRFTEEDRARAVMRGLQFIYRTALNPKNFEKYGHDYLWCFYTLSEALRDTRVRRAARRMGLERARLWRRQHRFVPADADASLISELAYGADAADSLGLRDDVFKEQLKRAALRFKARDYLLFDPLTEAPPTDVPAECERCGADNPRGRHVCFVCKKPLTMRTRYDVWYDALITTYVGEHSGVPLGARYVDVLKWLPTLRPYRATSNSDDEEFYDTVYAITHIVYTLNNYGQHKLSPQWLPQEFEFLKTNLKEAIAQADDDMLGEFMDSLRAFGLTTEDPLIRSGMEYYLSHQNPDGSWGPRREKDIYLRYHPTWNAVAGLSEYRWRGEGLSFPEVRPLLEQWAEQSQGRVRHLPVTSSARIFATITPL